MARAGYKFQSAWGWIHLYFSGSGLLAGDHKNGSLIYAGNSPEIRYGEASISLTTFVCPYHLKGEVGPSDRPWEPAGFIARVNLGRNIIETW